MSEPNTGFLTEGILDYLTKLRKRKISKVGGAELKASLTKLGDKTEKEALGGFDFNQKSFLIDDVVKGLTTGRKNKVAKEREAFPYEMHYENRYGEFFPPSLNLPAVKSASKQAKRRAALNLFMDGHHTHFEDPDTIEDPDIKKYVATHAKLVARQHTELQKLDNTPESLRVQSNYEEMNRIRKRQTEITDFAKQTALEKNAPFIEAYDKAREERNEFYRNTWADIHTKKVALANKAEVEASNFARSKEGRTLFVEDPDKYYTSIHNIRFNHPEIVAYNEAVAHHAKTMTDLDSAVHKAGVEREENHQKHFSAALAPFEDERRDLTKKYNDFHEENYKLNQAKFDKQDEVRNRYHSLFQTLEGEPGAGKRLGFKNYTEHVAQSTPPEGSQEPQMRPSQKQFDNEVYGGGHWYDLPGRSEFSVITSDLDHPKLGKTLFVHEIQSDLHQKTYNDSPLKNSWREHAMAHIHDVASKGGYEHVMFAPPSVQYVNNTEGPTHPDILNLALNRDISATRLKDAKDYVQNNTYHQNMSTSIEELKGDKAFNLAKNYHEEVLPLAAKFFGHDPEHHEHRYKGERGQGLEHFHDFPVFSLPENQKKVEEQFERDYASLVDSIAFNVLHHF